MPNEVRVLLSPPFYYHQQTMHNPELPVATVIAAVLVLIPVPTQLRLRNIPVLALLGGAFFLNVVYLVGVLVWAGDVHDVAPVWCDICKSCHHFMAFLINLKLCSS